MLSTSFGHPYLSDSGLAYFPSSSLKYSDGNDSPSLFYAMYNGAQIPLLAWLISCFSPFYLPFFPSISCQLHFAHLFSVLKTLLSSPIFHGFFFFTFYLYCSEFEVSCLLYLAISLMWMDSLHCGWENWSRPGFTSLMSLNSILKSSKISLHNVGVLDYIDGLRDYDGMTAFQFIYWMYRILKSLASWTSDDPRMDPFSHAPQPHFIPLRMFNLDKYN